MKTKQWNSLRVGSLVLLKTSDGPCWWRIARPALENKRVRVCQIACPVHRRLFPFKEYYCDVQYFLGTPYEN